MYSVMFEQSSTSSVIGILSLHISKILIVALYSYTFGSGRIEEGANRGWAGFKHILKMNLFAPCENADLDTDSMQAPHHSNTDSTNSS